MLKWIFLFSLIFFIVMVFKKHVKRTTATRVVVKRMWFGPPGKLPPAPPSRWGYSNLRLKRG